MDMWSAISAVLVILILTVEVQPSSNSQCLQDSVQDGFSSFFTMSAGNYNPMTVTLQECAATCGSLGKPTSALEHQETEIPFMVCICSELQHSQSSILAQGTCEQCSGQPCRGQNGSALVTSSVGKLSQLNLTVSTEGALTTGQQIVLTGDADALNAIFVVNMGDGSRKFSVASMSTGPSGADSHITLQIAYHLPGYFTLEVSASVDGDSTNVVTSQRRVIVHAPAELSHFQCPEVWRPDVTYYCQLSALGSQIQAAVADNDEDISASPHIILPDTAWIRMGHSPPPVVGSIALNTAPSGEFRVAQVVPVSTQLRSVRWLGYGTGQCQLKLMRPQCSTGDWCMVDGDVMCSPHCSSNNYEHLTLTCPANFPILCLRQHQCTSDVQAACSGTSSPVRATFSQISTVAVIEIQASQMSSLTPTDVFVERGDTFQISCSSGAVASSATTDDRESDLDGSGASLGEVHYIEMILHPAVSPESTDTVLSPTAVSIAHECYTAPSMTTHRVHLKTSSNTDITESSRVTACQIPVANLSVLYAQQSGISQVTPPFYVSTHEDVFVGVSVQHGAPVSIEWHFGTSSVANASRDVNALVDQSAEYLGSGIFPNSGEFLVTITATNMHSVKLGIARTQLKLKAQHRVSPKWSVSIVSQGLIESVVAPFEPAIVAFECRLPMNEQLPTDALVMADFGDGFAFNSPRSLSDFGLDDSTSAGSAVNGYFVLTLEHTYFVEAKHVVNVTLFNQVSQQIKQTQVDIHERILDLKVEFRFQLDSDTVELEEGLGDDGNEFNNDKNTTFLMSMSQGTAVSYLLYNTTHDQMQFIGSFNVTDKYNPTEGEFYWLFDTNQLLNISVVAVDEVQISAPSVATIIITDALRPVSGIRLVEDLVVSSRGEEKPINVTFEAQSMLALCLVIDYGDRSPLAAYGEESVCVETFPYSTFMPEDLSTPMVLGHTYWQNGMYNVSVYLFNEISMVTDRVIVSITSFPCSRPELRVMGASELLEQAESYFKSAKITVETEAHSDCDVDLTIAKRWGISKVNETSGEFIEYIDVESALDSWNKSSLLIKPNFLDFGVFKLQYTLSLWETALEKPDDPYQVSVSSFLNIDRSPLEAIIVEGSVSLITRGWGQLLELNPARYSVDPDEPQSNNFLFEWYCKQMSEELALNSSEYTQTGLQQIPSLDAVQYSTSSINNGGCYGQGPGRLDYHHGQWILNTSKLQPFGVDITFEIIVVIHKDQRRAEASLLLEMISGRPPMLSIRCNDQKLCSPTVGGVFINPNKRLGVLAHCLQDCYAPLTYKWNVVGVDGENSPVPIDNIHEYIVSPPGYPELSLSADLFGNYSYLSRFQLSILCNNSHPLGRTGSATFYLILNKPPLVKNSLCQISRTSGLALIDVFSFNCQPAHDPEHHAIKAYTFRLVTENTELGVLRHKTLPSSKLPNINMRLPYGNVSVFYDTSDILGSTSTKHVITIATDVPNSLQYNTLMTGRIFSDAAKLGNATALLMIMLAAETIREAADWAQPGYVPPGMDASDAQQTVSNQNADALLGLNNIPMSSGSSITMASNGLASVLSSSIGSQAASLQIDSRTREGALSLASSIASGLDDADLSTPAEVGAVVADIATAFSAVTHNQATIVLDSNCSSVPAADLIRAQSMDYDVVIGDYDSETTIPDAKTQLACNIRDSVITGSTKTADTIENVVAKTKMSMAKKMVVGEEISVHAKGMSITLKMMENATFQKIQVGDSKTQVDLEEFCPTGDCSESVGIEVVQMPTNIRSSSEGSDQLSSNSPVVSIEVVSRKLETISANYLPKPVRITIPTGGPITSTQHNSTNQTEPDGCSSGCVFFSTNEVLKNNLTPLIYTRFSIEKRDSVVVVEFYPVTNNISSMFLMMNIGSMPTLASHQFYTMIEDITPSYPNNTQQTSENNLPKYEWFFNTSLVSNRTGTAYVSVGCWKNRSMAEYHTPTAPSITLNESLTWTFPTDFYVRTFTTGCFYYDDLNDRWTSYGTRVVAVLSDAVVCETTHLSSFSSGLFVEPNLIDFSYVFANASFSENVTIYMTLILFGLIMCVLCIWARYNDKEDMQKIGVNPLPDNQPSYKYLYEISVFTGHKRYASTHSQVYFKLSGDRDETCTRTFGRDKCLFRRGANDIFVMSCARPLGSLQYLRLWHDNSGHGRFSSWHVLYVGVRDVQTKRHWTFVVNKWLAVDEDDGKLDRVITVSGDRQLTEFSHLFAHSSQRRLADGHLWFSVFLRPIRSRFTRVQRVVTCFTLLYLSMMVSAMWYGVVPSKPDSGSLQFGPLSMSPEEIFIGLASNLIVFPPSFLIVFLFRRSRLRTKRRSHIDEALEKQPFGNNIANDRKPSLRTSNAKLNAKKKFTLPWWCTIVAWILNIVCLCGSIFIIWAYGIQFGNEKTSKWLTSLLISFFSSIMLVQPMKVFLLSVIMSSIFKTVDLDEYDIANDELDPHLCRDEEWLFMESSNKDGIIEKHTSDESPLDKNTQELLRENQMKKIQMNAILKDIISYFMFLWILYVLSYDSRDPNAFYLKKNLENSFTKRGDRTHWKNDLDFSKVVNVSRFWSWSHSVLLTELRAQKWYDKITPPYGLRGFLDDRVNRIVGYGLIRQVRSRPNTCQPHSILTTIFHRCSGFTQAISEESTDHCAGWNITGSRQQCSREEYRYSTAEKLSSVPFWAAMNVYGGGGYVFELKGRKTDLHAKLTRLQSENWVDELTRAVFIQFSVYNAQVNMFGVVNLYLEQLPGGGLRPGWRIDGLRLIRHGSGFQAFLFILEIVYLLFIGYFAMREIRSMCRKRSAYFSSYWVYSEWAVIIISLAAVVVYFMRLLETNKILTRFSETYGNGYIQMQYVQTLDDLFGYMMGSLVFIATIKFSKLLRFNRRIGMLSVTLKQCWNDLTGFFLIFFIIIMSFSMVFNLLLVSYMREFSTILSSIDQCFAMMLNKFDFNTIYQSSLLAAAVFILFAIIISIVFVNLLLTIIIKAFTKIKNDVLKQPNDYEILDYLRSRMLAVMDKGKHDPFNRRISSISTNPNNLSLEEKFILLSERIKQIRLDPRETTDSENLRI